MLGKERVQLMYQNIDEKVPFAKLLGLTSNSFDAENACLTFPWRDEFAGHPKVLHGGVVAAVLDIAGAFVLMVHCANDPTYTIEKRLPSTIDMRVDYLLPGKGHHFVASGSILRLGKKVAVTRMELHNEKKELIAVGTGTFMIG